MRASRLIALLVLVLFPAAASATVGQTTLHVTAKMPSRASVGTPIKIRTTITNRGPSVATGHHGRRRGREADRHRRTAGTDPQRPHRGADRHPRGRQERDRDAEGHGSCDAPRLQLLRLRYLQHRSVDQPAVAHDRAHPGRRQQRLKRATSRCPEQRPGGDARRYPLVPGVLYCAAAMS